MSKTSTKAARIAEWEAKSAQCLADANEAAERGDTKRAETLYMISDRALAKATELRGWN